MGLDRNDPESFLELIEMYFTWFVMWYNKMDSRLVKS